jgi:hypothetical protein
MITNAIVAITLVTNLTQDIHPDGSRMTIVEEVLKQRVATWVEDGTVHSLTNFIRIDPPKVRRFRRVWQPIEVMPPPVPGPLPLSPHPLSPLNQFNPSSTILTNPASPYTLELRSNQYPTNVSIRSVPLFQGGTMLVVGVSNAVIVSPRFANGTDTNEPTADYCRMFRVDFQTETNWIYGLESSNELANWTLCPPEIDGTWQPDYFFDVDSEHKSYRLVLREGVLPEE